LAVRSLTIQSYQTADFQAEKKQAVSVGIFAGIVLFFQSPVTLAVSQADFSLPSPHPKIPFPAVGLEGRNPEARFDELNMQEHNIVELFDVVIRVMK
jgi:hypothetical protein